MTPGKAYPERLPISETDKGRVSKGKTVIPLSHWSFKYLYICCATASSLPCIMVGFCLPHICVKRVRQKALHVKKRNTKTYPSCKAPTAL